MTAVWVTALAGSSGAAHPILTLALTLNADPYPNSDLDRKCSVTYSRIFYDASGAQFDITPGVQMMTDVALNDLNRRTPDSLILSITVPPKAAPGKGALISVLDYVCNPVQQLYPVSMLVTIDVEVL